MYIPANTPNSTSSTSNWRQRRPDLSLIKSPLWSYSNNLERSYPSPPMSNSPTSPRSSTQFPEARSAGNFNDPSSSAPAAQTLQAHRRSMEGPMLAPPVGFQQQQFGQGRGYYAEQRPELQPRPITSHPYPPQYHEGYMPHAQGPAPLPLVPSSRSQVPGTATFQGPTSLSSSANPRTQRTSRRTKAHVARACQNCKKAHLSCDEARPCARCVASGKQATCIDVEHKKRGRPRLRDDREQRLEQAAAATVAAVQAGGHTAVSGRGHRREESLRVLRSQSFTGRGAGDNSGHIGQPAADPRSYGAVAGPSGGYPSHYPPAPEQVPAAGPLLSAFLNMDLRILRASEALRLLLVNGGDIRGSQLSEFVSDQFSGALQRVQNDLRDERTRREPMFLPGIFPEQQERDAVQNSEVEDVDALSQGFNDRTELYTFLLASRRTEQFQVRIRLARTTTFFATMILYPLAPPPPPAPSPYARAGLYPGLPPQPSPTRMSFQSAGPASPYMSTPGSPFSTLHTSLMTTLPPATSSIPGSYSYATAGSRSDQSYFGRQTQPIGTALMYPPPVPTSRPTSTPSEGRPSTAQERHRPESIGTWQLPPIVSSAPTTPLTSQFFEQGVPTTQSGSTSRRRTPERTSDNDEEDSRKRRRLNIKEIIEK